MRKIWFGILTITLLLSAFAYCCMVWPAGAEETLLANWKFDEVDGDIAHDSSGNGKDIILYGDPTWVSGYSGNALEFDGSDDYGTYPTLYTTSPTSLKVQALVYPHDVNASIAHHGSRKIIWHGNIGAFDQQVIGGNVFFDVRLGDGRWHAIGVKATINTWYNVTGIWTEGGYMWLYLDDVLVAATEVPDYGLIASGGGTPTIGAYGGGVESFFNGTIDEVKVYSGVSPPPAPPPSFYNLTISSSTYEYLDFGAHPFPFPGNYMYLPGTEVNVMAFEDAGGQYVFDHWELNGINVGSQNPYPLTMDASYTLHAIFVPASSVVTIDAYCYTEATAVSVGITMDGNPTGFNTPHTFTGITGTHTFTVPDIDPSDHPFKQWSTGETSTTITVTTAGTYTAYYATKYNLTITTNTGGTTSPASGTYTHWDGTTVHVTAIPALGYLLDHWELDGDDVGTPNPISVTMNTDHTLHAVFSWVGTCNLTITVTAGGTTSPAPGTYTYTNGTVATVTAIPNIGYIFDYWELNGTNVGSANPYPLTMDANYALHAVFVPIPPYDVTIDAYCYTEATAVSVGITMDGNPTGFNTPHTFTDLAGSHTFTVPDTDAKGHPFKRWSTASTSTTIVVDSGGTYTAYYKVRPVVKRPGGSDDDLRPPEQEIH